MFRSVCIDLKRHVALANHVMILANDKVIINDHRFLQALKLSSHPRL